MNIQDFTTPQTIVWICPETKRPVLALLHPDGEILCLHEELPSEEIAKINDFIHSI